MTGSKRIIGIIILGVATWLAFSASGCQKIKAFLIAPPSDGVIQKSYPINANAYRLPLVVHASPGEFMNYFAKDVIWLEKNADIIQVGTGKLKPHTDMTRAGNSVDLSVRVLGLNLPFKMICLKHKPEEELWWMMVFTNDSWILLRFNLKPIPEGCALKIDVLGQVSKYLATIVDSFKALEAIALRADLIMALAQSEFDPKLDIEKVTSKGVRGELYKTFLQGYESSIWVDASPRRVTEWIFSDQDNINNLIPNLDFKDECLDNYRTLFTNPEETMYCPSTYQVGEKEVPAQVLSKGGWEDANTLKSNSNIFWITVLDSLMKVNVNVEKKGHGSELKFIYSTELPESTATEAMDLMMGITRIPAQTEEILLEIKAQLESRALTSSGQTY